MEKVGARAAHIGCASVATVVPVISFSHDGGTNGNDCHTKLLHWGFPLP